MKTSVFVPADGAKPQSASKNGKKTDSGSGSTGFFTWFIVLALLGVWTSVAVVYFDLVDYQGVLGKYVVTPAGQVGPLTWTSRPFSSVNELLLLNMSHEAVSLNVAAVLMFVLCFACRQG